jgi:hypothetical protein
VHIHNYTCICANSNPQSQGKCINILTMKPHKFLECGWAKFELNNSMKNLLEFSFWHSSSLSKFIKKKTNKCMILKLIQRSIQKNYYDLKIFTLRCQKMLLKGL